MFAFNGIRDEPKKIWVFSVKGYGNILLRLIGVCYPIVIYASGGGYFLLINLLKVNVQKKI